MIITILVGIAILIALFIGYYLLSHLNKQLFNIPVRDNPQLEKTTKFGGFTFIILAILGLIALFLQNDILILIVLLCTTVTGTLIEIIIMGIISRQNR
ncbi:MAG: hypothetical protein ABF679_06005 [Lentilactobacillus diolivorans]|jgi:uncharacterized iron-regulated membrane protein|uniref:DUF3784 domain-containing protein n=2 Tax=Lentilactobacillus diolivorans TaxID=179838 RepID=A0A0R1SHX0_9LACO|nr:hypothetical protein [Lentilactobacillus diolivorans]KRL69005.1 hypothetical protein FC85_GL002224 [Lentilactobacillus diolivorans DSM 14421]MCH4163424.1 hypothetical protein [Lentilactobacillus diolivorans]RRG04488.1 MAG: hypothetical protein DUD34_00985 [Lactobacillus sp.]GEP22548.1 hypothetical protein LDI01_01410 [Lentilactobacillus diolivorans]